MAGGPTAELSHRLIAAFPVGEPPPAERIALAGAPPRIVAALAGWRWDNLSEDRIAAIRGDLAFLQPAAFIYYLPALLRYLLPDPNRGDVLIDDLLERLAPPDPDAVKHSAALLETMGPEGEQAARELLEGGGISLSREMRASFDEQTRYLSDAQIATILAVIEHWQNTWSASLHPKPVGRALEWLRTQRDGRMPSG